MKYQRDDVAVDAVQYQAADLEATIKFLDEHAIQHDLSDDGRMALHLFSPHGDLTIRDGDWIVKEPTLLVSMGAEDFAKMYQPAGGHGLHAEPGHHAVEPGHHAVEKGKAAEPLQQEHHEAHEAPKTPRGRH